MNISLKTKTQINNNNSINNTKNDYVILAFLSFSFFLFISITGGSNPISFEYVMAQTNGTSKNIDSNTFTNTTNVTSKINSNASTNSNGGLLGNLPVIDDTLP
jgi:hypothetical protein